MNAPSVGWYGKLPSLGDFATRRLPPRLVEPWDAWLTAGLAHWRADDPQWLAAYLAAPSWRFLLPAGLLGRGSPVLAGVLLPSVDSVGRYFPLTLLQALPAVPADAAAAQALLLWLHRLDDVAVDALQDDWRIDQLDHALAALGPPVAPGDASLAPPWAGQLARCAPPEACALWWRSDAHGAPHLSSSRGLPQRQAFVDLITGLDSRPATAPAA